MSAYGDRFVFIKDSIAKKEIVESVFSKYHPQVVVNLAAQLGYVIVSLIPMPILKVTLLDFITSLKLAAIIAWST